MTRSPSFSRSSSSTRMNMRPFFASSMISSGLERKAWRRCASVGLGLATIMLHALQVAGENVDLDIDRPAGRERAQRRHRLRSEEHTSELQSLMRISYAVFCLKKKKNKKH